MELSGEVCGRVRLMRHTDLGGHCLLDGGGYGCGCGDGVMGWRRGRDVK